MKKLYFLLAAATLLAACQDDFVVDVPAEANAPWEVTIKAEIAPGEGRTGMDGDWMVSEIGDDPASRTTLNGFSVNWTAGDVICLIPFSGSTLYNGSTDFLTYSSGDTFTGNFLYGGYSTYALYPYSAVTAGRMDVPSPQIQAQSGAYTAYDYLYSGAFTIASPYKSVTSVKFHHMFSVVKFVITAKNFTASDGIKKIALKDVQKSPFCTRAAIDVTGAISYSNPASILDVSAGESGHVFASAGTTYTAYLAVPQQPGAQLGKLQVEITLNDNSTKTINIGKPSGGAFGKGMLYTITRELDFNRQYYADKDVVKLQTHSVGSGVKVVLMGDGYTASAMEKGYGKYEMDMRTATDNFFSVYPMSEFRNYFDVWMIAAVSAETGMSCSNPAKTVNTVFSSLWAGSGSTHISCSQSTVFSYLRSISDLGLSSVSDGQMPGQSITVIMPINEDVYAGTCAFWIAENSMSIGMTPVNTRTGNQSFKATIVHESCGHGFSKLLDEYIYYDATYPDVEEDKGYKTSASVFENIDFYNNMSQTTWAGFAAEPVKYSMVGIFEGAGLYAHGIWRPESNSCMNNNVPYFNAPSRFAQVRRIMKLSGVDTNYTLAKFMAWDTPPDPDVMVNNAPSAEFHAPMLPFVPLGEPIIMPMPDAAK